MTSPIKYNKIMEKVNVTPEMHDRILNNLRHMNTDLTSTKLEKRRFNFKQKSAILAACVVLLFAGGIITYQYQSNSNTPNNVVTAPSIVNYASLQELVDGTGIRINEIKHLPFVVKQTFYSAFGNDLAQIQYSGENNGATFRVSGNSDNNSGIYDEFPDVIQIAIGSNTATVKGNSGKYSLALWSSDGLSYSLSLEKGISKDEILSIITSLE